MFKPKYTIPLLGFIAILSIGYAVNNVPQQSQNTGSAGILRVYQGGTGTTTFPVGQCLKGNGVGALTTGACGTGGGGGGSPLTTKGDLYTFDSTNTALAVGLNGQVLMASSSASKGIAWMSTSTLGISSGGTTYSAGTGLTLLGSTFYRATSSNKGYLDYTDYTGAANFIATNTLGLAISDTTGTLTVSRGGTGSTTLSGILKGSGAGSVVTATPGTDYLSSVVADSPLGGSGTSGSHLTFTNPGYILGNQSITLSGAVSGSGATSITTSYAGLLPLANFATSSNSLGYVLQINSSTGLSNWVATTTLGLQPLLNSISYDPYGQATNTAIAFQGAASTSFPTFGYASSTYLTQSYASTSYLKIASSTWGATTTGAVWYTGGVVGIGTTSASFTNSSSTILEIASSSPSYLQAVIKNTNSTASASADMVLENNIGTDNTYFLNMGLNSSGFSQPGSWTVNGANDGYLYNNGGNLSIGVASSTKYLSFFTGGTLSTNERFRIDASGNVMIGTTSSSNLLTVGATSSKQFLVDNNGNITGVNATFTGIVTLPNGNVFTNSTGNIAVRNGNLIYNTGSATTTIIQTFDKSVYLASTTIDKKYNSFNTATGTWELWNPYATTTLVSLYCETDTGTANAYCGNGSASTSFVCAVNGTASAVSATTQINPRGTFVCQVGTQATNPNKVTLTATFKNTGW